MIEVTSEMLKTSIEKVGKHSAMIYIPQHILQEIADDLTARLNGTAQENSAVQVEINKNTVGKQSTIDLGDGMAFTFTLARADEDDWTFRVKLFQDQAILGFPKHNTIGIGFAQESKEGWNTNLPYTVDALEIYEHIKSNKKYDEITDDQCLKAIKAIQECAKASREAKG